MDDLNDVIPRLQAYIKILEKKKNTPKEELIFQKERLKKIIDLTKKKINNYIFDFKNFNSFNIL